MVFEVRSAGFLFDVRSYVEGIEMHRFLEVFGVGLEEGGGGVGMVVER